jgi:hypothetical protein
MSSHADRARFLGKSRSRHAKAACDALKAERIRQLREEREARRYSLPKAGDTLADAIAVLFIMLGGAVLIAFASTIGG